jgi:hypothetical protein
MKRMCYYCDIEFETGKNSKGDHVIPDALGGGISFKDVCPDCNGKFNKNIDYPVIYSLMPFIIFFQIHPDKDSADSKMPFEFFSYLDQNNGVIKNIKGDMTNSGEIITSTMKIDDKTLFVNSKKEAEKHKGFKGEIKTRSPQAFVGGTAAFSPVDTITQNRFDIKVFLNLIGSKLGSEALHSLNLDRAKSFVNGNSELCFNYTAKKCDIGDNSGTKHIVRVYKADNNLFGEIALFDNQIRKYQINDDCNVDFEEIEEIINIIPPTR